ncbi:hypothetical protein ABPG74_003132 [Tetrahymena malaccensis]
MEQSKIEAALSLIRRLPPQKIHYNATAVSNLIDDQADEFLQKIDQPLEIGICSVTQREFIKCEFNRDGNSYRSPYSNVYHPPFEDGEDGVVPMQDTRDLEIKANELFLEYQKLYYQGGLSNIYFFDKDDGSIACAYVVKKDVDRVNGVEKGTWDSINVVDIKITDPSKKKIVYKCTSSVILEMEISDVSAGKVNISGTLTKSKEDTKVLDGTTDLHAFHLKNIGQIIEDMEGMLRNDLDNFYIGKTKQSIFEMRDLHGHQEIENIKKGLAKDLLSRQAV